MYLVKDHTKNLASVSTQRHLESFSCNESKYSSAHPIFKVRYFKDFGFFCPKIILGHLTRSNCIDSLQFWEWDCKLWPILSLKILLHRPKKWGFCWIAQYSQQCWEWNVVRFYSHMVANIHGKNHFEIQMRLENISIFHVFYKSFKIASRWGCEEAEAKILLWLLTRYILVPSCQIRAQ